MRSLTPILEEGVFSLRFGSIGADVTEEMFSLTGHGGNLKPLAVPMPCSMPASLSPTPLSRRESGPVGTHRPLQQNNHLNHSHNNNNNNNNSINLQQQRQQQNQFNQNHLAQHHQQQHHLQASSVVVNGDDVDDYRPSSGARLQGHRRLDRCLSEPTTATSRNNSSSNNNNNNASNGSHGSSNGNRNAVGNSSRYKTELCRAFEETGHCKYGEKCQFAHGHQELRTIHRHRKYKTELCRTYHTIGFCPYGPRCHFIHNAEEARTKPAPAPPRPLSMSSSSSSTTSSPTHSDSLSGSPTSSYGGFWNPIDDDHHQIQLHHHQRLLHLESPPTFHSNHQDLDIFVAAPKPTIAVDFAQIKTEFPDFLGAPVCSAPRLPVFSRLAGADAEPSDR